MKRNKPFGYEPDADVIDLAAYRRGRSERAGHHPAIVAAHLLAETGITPSWDCLGVAIGSGLDFGGWDDAA